MHNNNQEEFNQWIGRQIDVLDGILHTMRLNRLLEANGIERVTYRPNEL